MHNYIFIYNMEFAYFPAIDENLVSVDLRDEAMQMEVAKSHLPVSKFKGITLLFNIYKPNWNQVF